MARGLIIILVLLCGCSYVSRNAVSVSGENVDAPFMGFRSIKGEVVDMEISREMVLKILSK